MVVWALRDGNKNQNIVRSLAVCNDLPAIQKDQGFAVTSRISMRLKENFTCRQKAGSREGRVIFICYGIKKKIVAFGFISLHALTLATHVLSFEYQDRKKAGEVAQWVKVPPAEPGILGVIPGTHKVEGEKPRLRSYRMSLPHTLQCAGLSVDQLKPSVVIS